MKKLLALSVCLSVHMGLMSACHNDKHPTTRPTSVRERQDAALADPFGYSPDVSSSDTDISGGKVNELNRGAMRKDLDHVLNP